jgi:hypothetical protein
MRFSFREAIRPFAAQLRADKADYGAGRRRTAGAVTFAAKRLLFPHR